MVFGYRRPDPFETWKNLFDQTDLSWAIWFNDVQWHNGWGLEVFSKEFPTCSQIFPSSQSIRLRLPEISPRCHSHGFEIRLLWIRFCHGGHDERCQIGRNRSNDFATAAQLQDQGERLAALHDFPVACPEVLRFENSKDIKGIYGIYLYNYIFIDGLRWTFRGVAFIWLMYVLISMQYYVVIHI